MKKYLFSFSIIFSFLIHFKPVFAENISENFLKENNKIAFEFSGLVNASAIRKNEKHSFEKNYLADNKTKNLFSEQNLLATDSRFYLKVGFMTQNKEKYGIVTKFNAKASSDDAGNVFNFDKAFLFKEGKIGKIEFGNNQAVNQKMKVSPTLIASGAGGIGGRYLEHINFPMSLDNSTNNLKLPHFILLAQSPIGHGGYAKSFYGTTNSDNYSNLQKENRFYRNRINTLRDGSFDGVEDATKINYYTPRINNIQFGASYAENSNSNGIVNKNQDGEVVNLKNIFSAGINYVNDFDNLNIAISSTVEKAKAKSSNIKRNDLLSYDVGFLLSYFGFSLSSSYGSWGKSLQPKSGIYSCDYNQNLSINSQNCSNQNKKSYNSQYYTFGLSYEIGPVSASFTGLRSEFQRNKYQANSFGVSYKIKKSLISYIEYTNFSFKSNQPKASDYSTKLVDNRGYVILTGFLFLF